MGSAGTTALIMAQGQQQRIGHILKSPKQLISLSGEETILGRTVRLIRAFVANRLVAVVHGGSQLGQACQELGVEAYTQPDPGYSVVGGIRNVLHLWGGRTVVFLGDVVYSRAAVSAMMGSSGPSFFGRLTPNAITGKRFPELFGVAFSESDHPQLLDATSVEGWRIHCDTKLWDLRQRLNWPTTQISDFTDDVDTEDDYTKCLPALREAARLDG